MSRHTKLQRRIEAAIRKRTERFDLFGDGSAMMTLGEIKMLMRYLDGTSRGLPSEQIWDD
jgi:hypothetical protein